MTRVWGKYPTPPMEPFDVDEAGDAQEYIPEQVYVAEFEGQEPAQYAPHYAEDDRMTDEKARRAYEISKLGYDPLNVAGGIEGSEGEGWGDIDPPTPEPKPFMKIVKGEF